MEKHTLKVKIGNSIAPKDMFQMMFTSDEPSEILESRAEGLVKVEFINQLKQETKETYNKLNESLKQDYQQSFEDIKSYQKAKEETIDANVSALVKKITKQILSKTISKDAHQELILDALKRAKESNIFY